ncbi:MAG: GNAT family N-acetyltransferase [Cellulosilyticaceae bacterium]
MKHCGTETIETVRLHLRQFVREDAEAMYRNWASDEDVTRFLTWRAHSDASVSKQVLVEWINNYARSDFYQWAITLKEDVTEPIGSISVVAYNDQIGKVEIGYCIGQQWWHKGITSEALQNVISFLFEKVEVSRIEARHDPQNENSGEVMKKCGMKYEGTMRQADWNNQGVCDVCYYALLKDER